MSENLIITVGELIPSATTQYQVQKHLGSGSFGLVLQCRNVTTNEMVALKINKGTGSLDCAEDEVTILELLKGLQSNRFNIVSFMESFVYKEHSFLVFEHLDMDLDKFKQINPGQCLALRQIRPILQQLATSLAFLQSAGIIHTDLKPDNIMLVDHVKQPLSVKIIDFGLAINNPEDQIGLVFQSLWYRSPEILQEAPFSGAIDIWSLGCIIAELFMGRALFPACNEVDLWNQILYAVGQHVVVGNHIQQYFWPQHWMEQRFMATRCGPPTIDDYAEQIDLGWFIDLLKKMLTLEPSRRITPRGILEHPFITMTDLGGPYRNSLYVTSSMYAMSSFQNKKCHDRGDGDQKIQPMGSFKRTAKPPKSKRKNKREGAALDAKPTKRQVRLKKELSDVLKAMENAEAAGPAPPKFPAQEE